MKETRLKIAKPDIIKLFEGSYKKIFNKADLEKILDENRSFWRVAQSTKTEGFINFLLKETKLKKIKFDFAYRPEIRYTWGVVDIYETILSTKPNSYFTHFTAMFLNDLTEQLPKTIYFNFEQPPKRNRPLELEQSRIDMAFNRKVRVSNNIANYKGWKIISLNGMFTEQLGVISMKGPEENELRVTNIERTLIDIAVRPVYSGGVFEVLKAYQKAKGLVSINKLVAMLRKLNYTYPYHQVIGFYLEKSGVYKSNVINLLLKFPIKYNFYLTHQMKDVSFSEKWKLFFPKGF